MAESRQRRGLTLGRRRHRLFAVGSIVLSLAAAAYLVTATNIVEISGRGAYASLAIPAALGVVALSTRRSTIVVTCAVLLSGYCLLALLSVGVFFVPAAVVLIVGATLGCLDKSSQS